MIDLRLKKILNRYAEIGGGAFVKVPEEWIRLANVIETIENEILLVSMRKVQDPELLTILNSRLVIKRRELSLLMSKPRV